MFSLAQLKTQPELIARIDWQITPQEAFEAYQLKSPGNSDYRDLQEVYYFYFSSWRGEGKLVLVRRTYKESETLAELDPPAELAQAALKAGQGADMPRGQLPLDDALLAWLKNELGI
jgi:hypothetical protein